MLIPITVGLFITFGLGFLVGPLMNIYKKSLRKYEGDCKALQQIFPNPQESEGYNWWKTPGFWVGVLERPIFFVSFLDPGVWALGSSWLVLKTAIYWQNSSYGEIRDKLDDADLAELYRVRQYHATYALVGTAANIVIALIGVAVSKWLQSTPSGI